MPGIRKDLTQLRKMLIRHFSIEELRVLCFDLGIDYEELEGTTKTTKMQDLILYLQRRGVLDQLIDAAKEERSGVNWPDVTEIIEASPKSQQEDGSYVDEKTGLEMIRIPAGEFLYGDDKRIDYLPEYWISKTPVTNRHYVRFVRETNYEPPKHWEGAAPPGDIADHPVVYVSWNDATAYAEWAKMQLPTEREWEKAAHGVDGYKYPWGNDWRQNHCNSSEIWGAVGRGKTTPVGEFSPQGDSPYGCVDMAGNVWEWINSHEARYRSRILRGGSWSLYPDFAREEDRLHARPAARIKYYGFRLILRHPSQ